MDRDEKKGLFEVMVKTLENALGWMPEAMLMAAS